MKDTEIDFRCCRACLSPVGAPRTEWNFINLHVANGENAEKLKLISGIDISDGADEHDALMCCRCFLDLERSYGLRQQIIKAETQYFKLKREEFNANLQLKLEIEIGPEQFEDYVMADIEVADANKDTNISQELQPQTFEEAKFECQFCYRVFRDKSRLRSHLKNAHKSETHKENSNMKPSKSRLANTHNKSKSVEHNRASRATVETKVLKKTFECSFCNKMLSGNHKLKCHIEAIHDKLTRFTCDKCPLKIYNKCNLRNHLMCHAKNPNYKVKPHDTADSTRPFKCDYGNCEKNFTTKKSLEIHQTVHSDARPFSCWCGKTFKRSDHLRRHSKDTHNNVVSNPHIAKKTIVKE